jgi:DtxR family Mn-dependent transcriptional regulator
MAKQSMEDYLKTVYDLSKDGEPVNNTDIAKTLNIAPASVTEMLKKLAEKKYIQYSPYHGITLTESGKKIAQKTLRKHRLLERFLSDVLKIDKVKVHSQACEMEHALSDDAEESLCRFLKHPESCPDDGKIIPPCDLQIGSCAECIQLHKQGLEEVGKRKENLVSLSELKEGQSGKISFIRGGHTVLQRLLDMGLTPGTKITLIKTAPFEGPIEILVRSSKLAIGRGIASKVFIEPEISEQHKGE